MSHNLDLIKAVRKVVADDECAKGIDLCTVDSSFQAKRINHLWSADGIDGVTHFEPPVTASWVDKDCACNRTYTSREQQRYDCHVYTKGLDCDGAAEDIGRELSGIDEDYKWFTWFFETHGDEFYSATMDSRRRTTSMAHLARLLLDDSDWVNKRTDHSSDYVLPFLNLQSFEATVDQTETMLRFLDLVINRVKYLPKDFFFTDLEQTELGWQTGLVDVTFNERCVVIRGYAYGTLCDYKKGEVHGGYSMGTPRYMVGLRGQRRLYGHIRRMLQSMVRPNPDMLRPDNTQWQTFIRQRSPSRLQSPLSYPDVDRHFGPPPTAKTVASWRYDLSQRKQSGSGPLLRLRIEPDHVPSRIEYLATQLADAAVPRSADHRRFVVFDGAIAQIDRVREAAKSLITEPCRTTAIAHEAALDSMTGLVDSSSQELCVDSSSELAQHWVYYREDRFEGRNEFVNYIDNELLAQRGCGLDRMPGFLDLLASDGIDRLEWLQPSHVLSVCAETLARPSLCKVPEPIPEILKDMAVLCQLGVSLRSLSPRLVDARRDSPLEIYLSFADPDEDGVLDEMRPKHRENVEPSPVFPVQRNGYQLLASGWMVNVILVSKQSQVTFWKLFDGRSSIRLEELELALKDAGFVQARKNDGSHVQFTRPPTGAVPAATLTLARHGTAGQKVDKHRVKYWKKDLVDQLDVTRESFILRKIG
nr:hypothetical protein B0A51_07112 [Rachicladosporium sp. CCFEE 5018]